MNARSDDFHVLRERVKLAGTLTTRTALRIGSGGADVLDVVDLPVLKDADGAPLIPGSSLKGALRSTVEALVRGAAKPERGLWACDPLSDQDHPDDPNRRKGCGSHAHGERAEAADSVADHCAVCRLLGSFVLASHVRFCDAMLRLSPEERRRGRLPLEIRDGVGIDRDLRRAADKRKYDFEVVAPGAEFELEVYVENPRPWLMGLLVMGFDQIAAGFTALGGFTSRGLGRMDLRWHELARARAVDLLEGSPPSVEEGEGLLATMDAWRQALAQRYQGAD